MSMTAIKNALIFTVDPQDTFYASGTIVLKDDHIISIGDSKTTPIPPDVTEIIDAQGKLAVLPGLIDAHSHSSALKGYSENLNLLKWLPVYQREHQVLTEDDAYIAALVSYLEAAKGGTTCVLDMYRYLHRCADAGDHVGIRTNLVPYVADAPGKDFFETLEKNKKLIETHHGSQQGRVRVWVGLEHLFYCSEKAYHKAREYADHYQVGIHTHTSELKDEVDEVVKAFGKRPVHLFKERGILGPTTLIAHCVWLNDEEIDIMADTQTSIAHCPTSNAKLAGGIAPLHKFEKKGITVGLGTDGSISNNSLSMIESMKFASLLQKILHYDAAALPAPKALRMATIDGAKALGLDKEIGSLEVGKKADLITINLWQPHLFPLTSSEGHNPVLWNLVYSARSSDVNHVWVDGRLIVKNGKSTRLDEEETLTLIHNKTKDLLERRKRTAAKGI